MITTRTGSFPIGIRHPVGWKWDLDALVRFAAENQFAGIDVAQEDEAGLRKIRDAGLTVGTVDLKDWPALASPDAGKRRAAAQANADYARMAAQHGVRNYFALVLPEDRARPRSENFAFAVDGYNQLCAGLAEVGARLAIEGWPGPRPYFPALACTPADYRAFLKELPEAVAGVNYDPSHLIRMGIDPLPFLREFAPRVYHVHAKDTEIIPEALQDHGTEQPATFDKPHRFGGHHWRYTIPGHGCARWVAILRVLRDAGYDGLVSIELEDENFAETEENTRLGFLASRDFLRYA